MLSRSVALLRQIDPSSSFARSAATYFARLSNEPGLHSQDQAPNHMSWLRDRRVKQALYIFIKSSSFRFPDLSPSREMTGCFKLPLASNCVRPSTHTKSVVGSVAHISAGLTESDRSIASTMIQTAS